LLNNLEDGINTKQVIKKRILFKIPIWFKKFFEKEYDKQFKEVFDLLRGVMGIDPMLQEKRILRKGIKDELMTKQWDL
jgi:hypothetical protein